MRQSNDFCLHELPSLARPSNDNALCAYAFDGTESAGSLSALWLRRKSRSERRECSSAPSPDSDHPDQRSVSNTPAISEVVQKHQHWELLPAEVVRANSNKLGA